MRLHAYARSVPHLSTSTDVLLSLAKSLRICLSHSWSRAIIPVVAWLLTLSTVVWTRIGQSPTRAPAFSPREGGHGGLPAPPYMRKHFTNLCQNSTGPRMTPQVPSEEPEVLCHLRRVRGVLTVKPGGTQTHLVKEVRSRFRIHRGRHNRSRITSLLHILLNSITNGVLNPNLNGPPLNPH